MQFAVMIVAKLIILFIGSAFASDVLDLGDDNFKAAVADKEMMLVEFFAPW